MIKNEKITELPQWIVDEMISFLYSNGLVMKNKDLSGTTHVPVSIFPSPVNKLIKKFYFLYLVCKIVIRKN